MIQKHTILLNPRFSTGSTVPAVASNSQLQNINGYQVSNIQGLGGGVVNQDNVRGFLNDENNQRIINDFFSYLTASTTTIEFAEIWHSDIKLAQVFNNYYDSSVLNNQVPSTAAIQGALTGTTGITVINNWHHNYDGVSPSKYLEYLPQSIDQSSRMLRVYSALTTYTDEESYYIPVHIRRHSGMMDRQRFFFDTEIQLILDQFVPTTGDTGGGGSNEYNDYGDYNSTTTVVSENQPISELPGINTDVFTPPPGNFVDVAPDTNTTGSTDTNNTTSPTSPIRPISESNLKDIQIRRI